METMLVSEERDAALAAADAALSLLAIEQYHRQVKWTAPLTPEEETALFERLERSRQAPHDRWRASLAQQARERLTEAYQPLVMQFAHHFARIASSMDWMDCVQQGNLGLLDALNRYCVTMPVRFELFAIPYIRYEIIKGLRELDAIVRLPKRVLDEVVKLRRVSRHLAEQTGDYPSCEQLAPLVGMTVQKVEEVVTCAECLAVWSLQALLRDESLEERFTVTSLYPSTNSDTELSCAMRQALAMLSPRQRQIVEMRYGIVEGESCPLSQAHVAARLGVSHNAVGITEKRAMSRLHEQLAMGDSSDALMKAIA